MSHIIIVSVLLKIYGDYNQSSGDAQLGYNGCLIAAEALSSDKIFPRDIFYKNLPLRSRGFGTIARRKKMLFTSPAVPLIPIIEQIPLIQVVNEDDQILLNSPGAEWFRILNDFLWQAETPFRTRHCQ